MLTYLKPGDVYECNDIIEPKRMLMDVRGLDGFTRYNIDAWGEYIKMGRQPLVIGACDYILPGDHVHQDDMVMQPRRWTPDTE